ncbi:MAG: hypothetical protein ACFFDN_24935, partial [Candidatus Hodarchaeota archaeon]
MSELIDEYLSHSERTGKTLRYYRSILFSFNNWLKAHRKSISNFEAKDVELYYKEKIDNDEWSTVETVGTFLKIIRGLCNWMLEGYEDKVIGLTGSSLTSTLRRMNKIKKIKKVKGPKMIRRIKAHDSVLKTELKKIFMLMLKDKNDTKRLNFMTMYTLCYWGIRPGDLRASAKEWIANPERIDELNKKVTLISAKTGIEYESF